MRRAGPDEPFPENPEFLETVDLGARVRPADEPPPDPDSTAVLEIDQTVDLSGRLNAENSRRG